MGSNPTAATILQRKIDMRIEKEELVEAARSWNQGHYRIFVGEAGDNFVVYVHGTDPLNEDRESYQEGVVRMFKLHFKEYENVTVERGGEIYAA